MNKKISFLGAGNMAEALIKGLLSGGVVEPARIIACDIDSGRLKYIEESLGVKTSKDITATVKDSDVIVISVKPHQVEELLKQAGPVFTKDKLVISIAAGITTAFIKNLLPAKTPVVRIMPNTPCLVGAGAIAMAPGDNASEKDLETAKQLLAASGTVVTVEESLINAVTALSGSGPAYVFYLAEAMEQAGAAMGLDKDTARKLAYETIFGAGKMLKELNTDAETLRGRVTSKGGTTEKAIESLDTNGFKEMLVNAIKKAEARAKELSR